MLNLPERVKIENAADILKGILGAVPIVRIDRVLLDAPTSGGGKRIDLAVHLMAGDRPHILLCEFKDPGQPRQVREALRQLKSYTQRGDETPVVMASWLSEAARAACVEAGASYIDLEGNCRLAFGAVFIERRTGDKPKAERRAATSLFAPKSAQVLRCMLRDVSRTWKLAELADEAGVSIGHISNVKMALLDREWATDDYGLRLSRPGALLDGWRDAYSPPPGARVGFYTPLHGSAFDEAAIRALARANHGDRGKALMASFSAARWLSPYVRGPDQHFYANWEAFDVLRQALELEHQDRGSNVTITIPKAEGVLLDFEELAHGLRVTSPVQTYLDLYVSGERGREAADHLRRNLLLWAQ